jgi:hypothetical protein
VTEGGAAVSREAIELIASIGAALERSRKRRRSARRASRASCPRRAGGRGGWKMKPPCCCAGGLPPSRARRRMVCWTAAAGAAEKRPHRAVQQRVQAGLQGAREGWRIRKAETVGRSGEAAGAVQARGGTFEAGLVPAAEAPVARRAGCLVHAFGLSGGAKLAAARGVLVPGRLRIWWHARWNARSHGGKFGVKMEK